MQWRLHGGLGALALAGVLGAGCDGGQTGDIGTSGGGCSAGERSQLTVEAADAAGYPASRVIARLVAGRQSEGEHLWLVAPPSLWLDVGVAPPPDRSLPARLTVQTGALHQVLGNCAEPTVEIEVKAQLTTHDPASLLEAHGSVGVTQGQPLVDGPVATLTLDGEERPQRPTLPLDGEEPATCELAPAGSEGHALSCGQLFASSRCVDPDARAKLPPSPGELPPLPELATAINAAPALELSCENGRRAAVALELTVPEQYCPGPATRTAPVVLSTEFTGIDLDTSGTPFWLSWEEGVHCVAPDCFFSQDCSLRPVDTAFDESEACARVAIANVPPSARDTRLAAEIVFNEDGQLVLAVTATGLTSSGDSTTCHGKVPL